MKTHNIACMAIAMFISLFSFAQGPTEGYVRYDADGMARSVMNLDVKQYAGTEREIADQYLIANNNWICAGENGNFVYLGTTFNPTGKHLAYIQKVNNIPVMGSELVISINNLNHISCIFNGYEKNITVNTNPAITSQQAIIAALATFTDPNMALAQPVQPELYIYTIVR